MGPRTIIALFAMLWLMSQLFTFAAQSEIRWDEVPVMLPIAGRAVAYVPRVPARHVVLFVSGDGGWNRGVVEMARRIAAQQAIVVGISYPAWRRSAARGSGCWYVASDLETIAHAAEKVLKVPQYEPPVLVGYSSGATAVYAALAGAPAVTFAGAMSLGFCPDLDIRREVCAGDDWTPEYDEKKGINVLPAAPKLERDWYVLHGLEDRVCSIAIVQRFVAGMRRAHLIEVSGTGHGFSKPIGWGASFDGALKALWTAKVEKANDARAQSATTRRLQDELERLDMPFEYRWPAQPTALLLFFSGDGGWASLDEEVAETLVENAIGVVGLSSLRYFWNAKSPAQVATDMHHAVDVLRRGGRPVFAGGFSFGAEVVPVALQEWAAPDRRALAGLVLISPGRSASFEIDPLDWLRTPKENPATAVGPAVRTLSLPALCLAGTDDEESACQSLGGAPGVQVVRLPGSHHFNNDFTAVADTVIRFIRGASAVK